MARLFTSALLALSVLSAQPAFAAQPAFVADSGVQVAAENCYSVGQKEAQKRGASLASAESVNQGGQTVCKIVLLYPASDNKHPRREEVTVRP